VDSASGPVLRLLDAVGISEDVRKCRSSLKDYTWDGDGLTAEIWRRTEVEPLATQSVRDRTSWKGYNTEVFYKKSFREWGISMSDSGQLTEMLRDYPIPLLGTALIHRTEHIGVLKVEFPTSGSVLRQFDKGDREFFEKAVRALTEEIVTFDRMLKGEWWRDEDLSANGEPCIRCYLEIIRTSLVSDGDCAGFWQAAENFLDGGADRVRTPGQVVERLPPSDRSVYAEVFREVGKGTMAGASNGLFKALMEALLSGN